MKREKKTKKQLPKLKVNESNLPNTFVFHLNEISKNARILEKNLKYVMEPYTATRLKVKRRNNLKDFIAVSGPLNITHFLILSETMNSVNLRISRVPRGPTLTFAIKEYSLNSEIWALSKRPFVPYKEHLNSALLILNNFDRSKFEHKLLTAFFQNLFPPVDVKNVRLKNLKRCVLFDYHKDGDVIYFRHYAISVKPSGINRSVKKVAVQSRVPDLSRFNDISNFIQDSGVFSDSEVEDEDAKVALPQTLHGTGNQKSEVSAVGLKEIGPRLTLHLLKIVQGVSEGDVLYHSLQHKSEEETQRIKRRLAEKKLLKAKRRREQERNVELKRKQKLASQSKDPSNNDAIV
ncbi:suppressor of SWI4 1 homolog isoform X2 [Zophobas morio]